MERPAAEERLQGRGHRQEGQGGEGPHDETRLGGVVQVPNLPPRRGDPRVEKGGAEGPEAGDGGAVAGGDEAAEGHREGLFEVAEEHPEDEEEVVV